MAKVHRLNGYDDLSIIDNFAQKFGQNPDWVYDHTSFGTVINFAALWKEKEEYSERFNFIWQEVNQPPRK